MILIISLVVAGLLALFIGRLVVGALKLILVVGAIVFMISVFHRGTLPWCGKKAPFTVPASITELCP